MSDDAAPKQSAPAPQTAGAADDKLAAVLAKDEEERTDEDWDLLASADPAKLNAAAANKGATTEQ